jgi:CrcB protein
MAIAPSGPPQPRDDTHTAPSLLLEARDFSFVGVGAIAGALLRWKLDNIPLANLIGCLLLGAITAHKPPRPAAMLLGGIGFCGSLTTFSSWILNLAQLLRGAGPLAVTGRVLMDLFSGLLAIGLGTLLGGWLKPLKNRLLFRR